MTNIDKNTADSKHFIHKCKKCNRPLNESDKTVEFCDGCFPEVIFKRLRKFIRVNQYIQKDDTLVALDELSEKLLPYIINKPVKLIHSKTSSIEYSAGFDLKKHISTKTPSDAKILLPVCLDDIEKLFLEHLFAGKAFSYKFPKNVVPIYYPLTKEEMYRLAKLLKAETYARKHSAITEFLDNFEKAFPGIKFNVKKSMT
jgi:hypothetical protein